jgi:hypothetical protein
VEVVAVQLERCHLRVPEARTAKVKIFLILQGGDGRLKDR